MIKVIDLATHAVVRHVTVGTQPETLLLTADGRTLIVSLRGTPAQLAFVDTRSLTVTATVPGTFGDLAALSRDGRFVVATVDRGVGGTGGVAVVDVCRRAVVRAWDYPGDRPTARNRVSAQRTAVARPAGGRPRPPSRPRRT
jgi:DNA-binding beta-propeller fold protein YncE